MHFKGVNNLLVFPIFVVLCAILLTTFKISGSSIAVVNQLITGKTADTLVGIARGIRSDEWGVATPISLAQTANNLGQINPFLGQGQNVTIFGDTPTNHWSTIFKPYNWSFFILPGDYAIITRWWLRAAFLLISLYVVLLKITNKNITVSILTVLSIFFSPFIQWWYSTNIGETVGFMMTILALTLSILEDKKTKTIIYKSLFLYYCLTAFMLTLYPPFLIATGWVVVTIVVSHIYKNKKLFIKSAIALLVSGVLTLTTTYVYFQNFHQEIALVKNTVYPGLRKITGGDFTIARLFGGIYNIELLGETSKQEQLFTNQSEASNFILLTPIILVGILFSKNRKPHPIEIGLIAFSTIAYIWLLFGLPETLPTILLLNKIPHARLLLGIGLADGLLLAKYLSTNNTVPKKVTCITTISILLFVILIGLQLQQSPALILIVSAISILITVTLLIAKSTAIKILLIFSIASSALVNPLQHGLLSQQSKDFLNSVSKINETSPGKWLVYNDFILRNYLPIMKIQTLNSTFFYPDKTFWSTLDPENKFNEQHNRFGHAIFFAENNNEIKITTTQPDVIHVEINPCNEKITLLEVKYIISPTKLTGTCLEFINQLNRYYVYKKQN